jgi:hypothetical protein
MKIKQITYQHRRDFEAIISCEFCDKEENLKSGYDDTYYHQHVIPEMKCSTCGKSTNGEGGEIDKVTTKYPEGYEI